MPPRSKTTKNVFDKKPKNLLRFANEILKQAIGKAERKGCWLIFGPEKNGKTWFTCWLAKELAKFERVAYVSAEEGLDESFKGAMRRAGITTADDILWDEYMPIELIIEKFSRPKSANIIIIDNLTMYLDEITPSELKKTLIDALPEKLFILVAHEERKEPYGALARMAKKVAKVIFHVKGLTTFITSRHSKGGEIVIDEEKSAIYWGDRVND